MNNSIVALLTDWVAQGRTLEAFAASPEFTGYLRSDVLAKRIARFDDTTYRLDETSSFYAGDKLVPVEISEDWGVTLSSSSKQADLIYSQAGRSIVTYVRGSGPALLDLYRIPAPLDDVVAVRGVTAAKTGQVRLMPGDSWIGEDPATTCARADVPEGAVFMRITGPTIVPYIHGFRLSDRSYSYSAFPDQVLTGRDFVGKFLKALLVEEDFVSSLTASELERTSVMIESMIEGEVLAPSSEWNLIQALGRISGSRAIAQLQRLREGGGVLAANAARAMSSNAA